MARLTLNRVNEVFWINGDRPPHLAIVMRPRGEDWLHDEMRRMRANGVETVISMLQPHEAEWLGLCAEQAAAERVGMEFLSFPIQGPARRCRRMWGPFADLLPMWREGSAKESM